MPHSDDPFHSFPGIVQNAFTVFLWQIKKTNNVHSQQPANLAHRQLLNDESVCATLVQRSQSEILEGGKY